MAEVKYQFDGIAAVSATMVFAAMAGGPLAFLTTGILGKITFFFLKKIMNGLANQGLAVLNLGIDFMAINFQQADYESAMDAAIKARDEIIGKRGKLTIEEQREIDEKVKAAFRKFAPFV